MINTFTNFMLTLIRRNPKGHAELDSASGIATIVALRDNLSQRYLTLSSIQHLAPYKTMIYLGNINKAPCIRDDSPKKSVRISCLLALTIKSYIMSSKTGYIYILSNKTRSVFYVGVTSDLIQRVYDHRNGNGSQFTSKYNVRYLIYYEQYNNIQKAIEREKQLKNWNRKWKLDLVREINPKLRDLWRDIRQ